MSLTRTYEVVFQECFSNSRDMIENVGKTLHIAGFYLKSSLMCMLDKMELT